MGSAEAIGSKITPAKSYCSIDLPTALRWPICFVLNQSHCDYATLIIRICLQLLYKPFVLGLGRGTKAFCEYFENELSIDPDNDLKNTKH